MQTEAHYQGAPILDVDPFSTEFLTDPYPFHEQLREAGPVVWIPKYKVWAMARYEEVRHVLDDWETFCSSAGGGLSNFNQEKPWRPPSIILEADPPMHNRTRGVLAPLLNRAALNKLREGFDEKAKLLVDSALARQEVDGVKDIAEVFPLQVFPDAVGLQKEGRENLLPYANMAFNAFGPRNELFEEAFKEAEKVTDWIMNQCRREALSEDGFGAQIYAAADAGEISEQEAGMLVRSLLTAGLDTTMYGITSALYSFASFPEQWSLIRENPALLRPAFEEVVRFQSPVQTFFRTTTCKTQVAGVPIDADQKVLLFLGAANRDPRRWEAPDTFDVRRRAVGHVGFGHGIHVCVGQMVARLEAESVLTELVKRVERIELNGEPVRRLNNTLRGLSSLPLKLYAAD
ncbi:cytochrome P450 [Pseudomaricurvus alkylphenolicus]|uniref:cytochrome P450 n=1 Tax=Pseudomaricurvus alkylphenolicus TaxID=1306991 RepID=UPI001420CF22|nr:cytochrome P450 [Pseudomaricurvus alkylphenolicus]NIB43440.1 cytochrome P450 [Pseudomaricurvus alkylphenolicus]